ncbi:MAG: IS200/IS605 family transposase [Planctomycetaceae bacterium]|jgi:REP element-mobilizing transposase RayT
MSTYLSLHYHLVFATKNRELRIKPTWMPRLHEYLGGSIRGMGGVCEIVGGVEDHVHLLVGLKATHTLSEVMRELKKGSSAWVHHAIGDKSFQWQEGYAAFTLGATTRASVRGYIADQEKHHRKQSFRDELIHLLQRAGVPFEARYLE